MNHFYLFLFLFCSFNLFSQPAEFFFGDTNQDLFSKIVVDVDGNYLLLGSKRETSNRIWLLKTSSTGEVIWEKTYTPFSSENNEYGHNLTMLPNGNLLIMGQIRTNSFSPEANAIVLLTDADGNQIWKKSYSNTTAAFNGVSNENGFLIVGWNDNTGSTNSGFIMQINNNGSFQWKKTVDVSSQTYVKHILPTTDGKYLLVGRTNGIGVSLEGVFLQKIDTDGTALWTRSFDTSFREEDYFSSQDFYFEPLGVVPMPNGSLWVVNPSEYNSDIKLLHLSAAGDLIEERTYGHSNIKEYPYALSLLSNGDWLICGRTEQQLENTQKLGAFAMRTTADGLELWRKYYTRPMITQRLFSGIERPDGSLLFSGMSNFNPNNSYDGWLLHTESNGNTLPWSVSGQVTIDLNNNCIADENEPPAQGWFLSADNGQSSSLLQTDENGLFSFNTYDATTLFTLLPNGAVENWAICENEFSVNSNSSNPQTELSFVVHPIDTECPSIEVSITQADLIRCENSTFFVSIKNKGIIESASQTLSLELDNALNFLTASEPAFENGQLIEFDIPPIPMLSEKTIKIDVRLNCNTQLGDTHPILASIHPLICEETWEGEKFEITGRCEADNVVFDMKNTGGGGPNASTTYKVFADNLLAANNVEVTLPESGQVESISFPADGRTWRVELAQPALYSGNRQPIAVVKACGLGKNGLYSINYQDAFPLDDATADRSSVSPPNTVGVPNKISATMHGFGFYNLTDNLDAIEYTARAQNPLNETVEEVNFVLTFSETLDKTTFETLAANVPVKTRLTDDGSIQITLSNIALEANATAMVRFRIRPFANTAPNDGSRSIFLVEGVAYFDNNEPIKLAAGFLNYAHDFQLEQDPYYDYPSEFFIFGGRNYDFGTNMTLAEDGSVFLGGETSSFSEGTTTNGLLIKTNNTGRALWQTAIKLDEGLNYIKGIRPLSDGGCIITGNSRLPNAPSNYLRDYYPYVAQVDHQGHLLWWNRQRPLDEEHGAWVNGLLNTSDEGALIFGYTENGDDNGIDEFYWKINHAGETEWISHEIITGSAFRPKKGIQLADGNFAFIGQNESTVLNFDLYLQKISVTGEKIWSKGYNAEHGIYNLGLASSPDGGIMAAGYSQWLIDEGEYGITPTFIKFTESGDFEWEKSPIIGPFQTARVYNIIDDPQGGYFVVGEIFADTTDHWNDMLLLKIDENADTLWWKHYGSKNTEQVNDIILPNDNQIMLWGYNQQRAPLYNLQALLVQTDREGNLYVDTKEILAKESGKCLLFPNPSHSTSHVILSPPPEKEVHWLVYNMAGQIVSRGVSLSGFFEIQSGNLKSGMYFLSFPDGRYPSQRLIVTH